MDKTLPLTESLFSAIQQDKFSQAKELLEQGANPNHVLPCGISPFHLAIGGDTHNALDFVQLLLQYKGNPNVRSADGMTPVHVAATWGRYNTLHLLLLNGGNPDLCDEDGCNAHDMAEENKSWDCLKILTTHHQTDRHQDDISHLDHSMTRYGLGSRSRIHSYPDGECSWSHHDSTDISSNSINVSLDSTGLPSYLQDDSTASGFSSPCNMEDKTNHQTTFFPDLDMKYQVKRRCSSNEFGHGNVNQMNTLSSQAVQFKSNVEAKPSFESTQDNEHGSDGWKDSTKSNDVEDYQSFTEQDEDDEFEQSNKQSFDQTLSSEYLEEVIMSNSCTGIDLTSPDHPALFIKDSRSHDGGDTPTLDKTVVYIPNRRSITHSVDTGQVHGSESLAIASLDVEDSHMSEESSAYVTCRSDDLMLSSANAYTRLQDNKPVKRPLRRVTFSDESTDSLVTETCGPAGGSDQQDTDDKCLRRVNGFKFTEDSCDLITSDEDSNLITSDEESKISNSNHPSRPELQHEDVSKHDSNSELDSVEYLYQDQDTGAALIERQCPSACGTNTTYQDLSSLDFSHVSLVDETIVYDWRDFQTDDEVEAVPKPSLSKELLQLTNKQIREEMQKYGEEAGPVTATTRMVYLNHLAKLQNDPDFAMRATNRQPTAQGFRWELADYLNTGHLAETDQKMMSEEQVMVAPFQNPNPQHQWREGTLKSSFNYVLLDPRVTKDLPGRCTQLTQLEAFRIFVAAIFYIGKGKRGRPYAHFYEALSTNKTCKEKEQTSRKTRKKQPGAKVRHILDIWAAGLGVVSLHCFQSVIPVEAYTREACMVDAIGLSRLTNIKKGDFYGPSSSLPARKRRQMGVFLLRKACQIFLVEGERQIRPADIAVGQ